MRVRLHGDLKCESCSQLIGNGKDVFLDLPELETLGDWVVEARGVYCLKCHMERKKED